MNDLLLYKVARLFHEERVRNSERKARFLEARKDESRLSEGTGAPRRSLLRLLPGRPSEA